jgi:hypothetical protein
VAGGWRRSHNEELYNFHASPNIIRLIKQRTCGRQIMEEMRNEHDILIRKFSGRRDHLENLSRNGRTILGWLFEK